MQDAAGYFRAVLVIDQYGILGPFAWPVIFRMCGLTPHRNKLQQTHTPSPSVMSSHLSLLSTGDPMLCRAAASAAVRPESSCGTVIP